MLGAETVVELSRLVSAKAQRETRFRARAVRIDSTVVEADVRYPTDAGLAGDRVRVLAREGRRLAAQAGGTGSWPAPIAWRRWRGAARRSSSRSASVWPVLAYNDDTYGRYA